MKVMKFGGTSVGSAEAIERTIAIIGGQVARKPLVVVSAMTKVTDLLYRIADTAASGDVEATEELLRQLRNRHVETAEILLEGHVDLMLQAGSKVNELCDELERLVRALCILGELSPRSKAIIISNGELLSSTIISYAMNARGIRTAWVDARRMMITDSNNLKGEPDVEEICRRAPGIIEAAFEGNDAVITQGFIGSTAEGEPTVLGRGGSDYSASLFGMAENAEVIEIWTDVDGVLTADPRKVSGTRRLSEISFEEAAEMAHFGAKVLHPMTIEPAVRKNIPIFVLNSMNPSNPGTSILQSDRIDTGVKSVSFKENIRVINIFSPSMIDVYGFLEKVFSIFRRHNVSVDLISTSEASISVTVDQSQSTEGVIRELSAFAQVVVEDDKSQVSVVGKGLNDIPGIVGKLFAPLEKYRIHMISQGASNINLSFVVDRQDMIPAVQTIHSVLFGKEEN